MVGTASAGAHVEKRRCPRTSRLGVSRQSRRDDHGMASAGREHTEGQIAKSESQTAKCRRAWAPTLLILGSTSW